MIYLQRVVEFFKLLRYFFPLILLKYILYLLQFVFTPFVSDFIERHYHIQMAGFDSSDIRSEMAATGVDPDCNPTKRYKKGEPSKTLFILDPDFSLGDVSTDDDFELVARPKKVDAPVVQEGTSQTVKEADPDLDISLASFLLDLKMSKSRTPTTQRNVIQGEESPDKEMAEEFAINKPQVSTDSRKFEQ